MSRTQADQTIGFGLIGAGMIANFHTRAIRALERSHNVHLAGVAGISQAEAAAFAQAHDIPFHTDSIDALLARPDIDVVCIVTPSGAHLEPALKAIEARKHLIVEKPLEISVERVDRLLDAAKKADVKVMAIFQARFSAGAKAMKKAIEAGRFGRLVLCSAYVKWHRSAQYYTGWKGSLALDGGGAVMNQSIHAVDLLQWFVGMPTEVFAWKTRCVHKNIEAEDTAVAAFRFPHGALGTLEATTAAFPGWERRIEICGEQGSAIIEDDRIVRWEFQTAQPEDAALLASTSQHSASGAGAPEQIGFEGHQTQIEEMIRALRNEAPLSVDGAQARNAVALISALYKSAESGAAVDVSSL